MRIASLITAKLNAVLSRRRPVCDRRSVGACNSVSDVRAISTNRMQFSVRNEPGRSARRRPLTKFTSDGPAETAMTGRVGWTATRHRLDTAECQGLQQYTAIATGS